LAFKKSVDLPYDEKNRFYSMIHALIENKNNFEIEQFMQMYAKKIQFLTLKDKDFLKLRWKN